MAPKIPFKRKAQPETNFMHANSSCSLRFFFLFSFRIFVSFQI